MNWQSLKVYGALTFVSLLYGVNYSILKIVTPTFIKPYGFIVYRVIITTLFFWIFNAVSMETIKWKSDGVRILLCAVTGVGVNQLTFFKGISITSAINASIIMTLTPILVLVWSSLLINEKITPRKVLGVVIGLVGAIIIVYSQESARVAGNWVGDVLVLLNGASYGCYLVLVKPLMSKYKPITIMTWIFTIGIFIVLPVGFNEATEIVPDTFPMEVWYSAAYAIIGVTVIAYFLNTWALIRVNASVVGAFVYLQPIFATTTAVLFFQEAFLIKHLIASIFVFVGVWLVTKR